MDMLACMHRTIYRTLLGLVEACVPNAYNGQYILHAVLEEVARLFSYLDCGFGLYSLGLDCGLDCLDCGFGLYL